MATVSSGIEVPQLYEFLVKNAQEPSIENDLDRVDCTCAVVVDIDRIDGAGFAMVGKDVPGTRKEPSAVGEV